MNICPAEVTLSKKLNPFQTQGCCCSRGRTKTDFFPKGSIVSDYQSSLTTKIKLSHDASPFFLLVLGHTRVLAGSRNQWNNKATAGQASRLTRFPQNGPGHQNRHQDTRYETFRLTVAHIHCMNKSYREAYCNIL